MDVWNKVEDCLLDLPDLSVGGREIKLVVVHHTWRPNHAQWKGDQSAENVKSFWLQRQEQEGWTNPPGGHFLVAPDGLIYIPFDDLSVPLNANSSLDANRHGIAIETVGDFDTGQDLLEGVQRHSLVGLIGGLLAHFDLSPTDLYFHRSFPAAHKSCPGTGLKLESFQSDAAFATEWARRKLGSGG